MKKNYEKRLSKKIFVWLLILLAVFLASYGVQYFLTSSVIINLFETYYIVSIVVLIIAKIATVVLAPLSWWVLYILAWTLLPFNESIVRLSVWNFVWISLAYFLWKWYWDKIIYWFWWKKWVKKSHYLLDKIHNRKSFLGIRIVFFFVEDLLNFIWWMSRVAYIPFIIISMILTTIFMLFVMFGSSIVFNYLLTIFSV